MTQHSHSFAFFSRLLDVPSTDPDDARRRKLLNLILSGVAVLSILAGVVTFVLANLLNIASRQDVITGIVSGLILFVGTIIFFAINRSQNIPGWVVSGTFLLFMSVILAFTDTPQELANGRSLFVFTIPIIMASILLRPAFSFVFAILGSIEVIILSEAASIELNTFAIVGFFLIAFVSWLSSRSLENALQELRTTNANLDQLVVERTSALAQSLARERIEAGRSIAILESIADGVIVYDIHGKAIVANPATIRLLDLPRDQVINSTINDLIRSKALNAKNRKILEGLLTSPGQLPTSYRIQWGKKTLSVSSAQVFDSEETRIGTVAVFRDYTHEAEVERMKDTILATVSHELRTPLNAILGYVEMLKEAVYGPINEKQAKASERIISNTRRLLDIVSDLLAQAQIEGGKMTIQARPFKPAELLDNIHGLMDKIAADKRLALTSEIDPQLPESIIGDPTRLQQILVNLVNNAVKFTEKGSVQIRFFRQDEQHWAMQVRDTGTGIPVEEMANIFDPFRQVDGSTTRKHAGFGLGLSIVKQLASLMGGEVAVKSTLGSGSIFTVTLPLAPTRRET